MRAHHLTVKTNLSEALQRKVAVGWLREMLQQDLHQVGLKDVAQRDPRQEGMQRSQCRPALAVGFAVRVPPLLYASVAFGGGQPAKSALAEPVLIP